jgi:sugar phosphate isomerase/epimerase
MATYQFSRLAGATSARRSAGIQLYTMQPLLLSDFAGTLRAIRRIGYREVETVGLLGQDAREFRRALDDAGLVAPSAHILSLESQALFVAVAKGQLSSTEAWAKIDNEMELTRLESIMNEMFMQAEVLGYQYLVLASMDRKLLRTRAGIDQIVSAMNKAGNSCHKRGLRFAFHAHLAEFGDIEGERAIDRILQATDPDRVFVELDFFWAAAAGIDVPQWLKKHSGRIHLGHVKDMAKSVVIPPNGFRDLTQLAGDPYEDLGYGQLDYRNWIPQARDAGMRHFFVERDNAPRPLENAARSFSNLEALLT